jgi:uncharacterized protein YegP (UPF0339 family)
MIFMKLVDIIFFSSIGFALAFVALWLVISLAIAHARNKKYSQKEPLDDKTIAENKPKAEEVQEEVPAEEAKVEEEKPEEQETAEEIKEEPVTEEAQEEAVEVQEAETAEEKPTEEESQELASNEVDDRQAADSEVEAREETPIVIAPVEEEKTQEQEENVEETPAEEVQEEPVAEEIAEETEEKASEAPAEQQEEVLESEENNVEAKQAEEEAPVEETPVEEQAREETVEQEEEIPAEEDKPEEAQEEAPIEAEPQEEAPAEEVEAEEETPVEAEAEEEIPAEEEPKAKPKKTVSNKKTAVVPVKKGRTYNGKYEVYQTADGYAYQLKASNGEILVISETYASKDGVMKAIDAVKKNLETGNVKIFSDKRGKYKFKLISKNYRTLAISANYNVEKSAVRASESFKKFALKADIVDIELPDNDASIATPIEITAKPDDKQGGKFVYEDFNGEFSWELRASNGQILCQMEGYTSKKGCMNSIDKFKENVSQGSFKCVQDKTGRYQFKLYSQAGRICAVGESYSTKQGAENAANSVVSFTKSSPIVEEKQKK